MQYIGCDNGDRSNCAFSLSFSNNDWFISIYDVVDGSLLDCVIYDGYENDEGSNWDISCNVYGSTGSDPIKSVAKYIMIHNVHRMEQKSI